MIDFNYQRVTGLFPVFEIKEPSIKPVSFIHHLAGGSGFKSTDGTTDKAFYKHTSSRTVVIKNQIAAYEGSPNAGEVHFEDYGGKIDLFKNQNAYALGLNMEYSKGTLVNDGGNIRIAGMKTEGHNGVVKTLNGGRTEVLGVFIYTIGYADQNIAHFESRNSAQSLTYAIANHGKSGYKNSIIEIRDGVEKRRNGIGDKTMRYSGFREKDRLPPDASVNVEISATGDAFNGFPNLVFMINNKAIGQQLVTAERKKNELQTIKFSPNKKGKMKILFSNNLYVQNKGDRNLFISAITHRHEHAEEYQWRMQKFSYL
jgi:Ca-dependent carbohydrate-binding module xylan-binding